MKLSSKNWIINGTGMLYTPPFMGNCALYRLHSKNCSILLYHKQNIFCEEYTTNEVGLLESTTCSMTWDQPEEVYFHHANSTAISLFELRESPFIVHKLSEVSSTSCRLGSLRFEIEPVFVSTNLMLRSYARTGIEHRHQIEDLDCWITTANDIHRIEIPTLPNDKGRFCWKVSIYDTNNQSLTKYSSQDELRLISFDINDGTHVNSTMQFDTKIR